MTETTSSRLPSLDGLRGVAALVVVVYHLSLTLPQMVELPVTAGPARGSLLWWFTSTPAQLAIAGQEAVLVFFVLSGLVVLRPVLRSSSFDWVAYYPQRVTRLYLPTLASLVLATVWILLTPQSPANSTSSWAAVSSTPHMTWQVFVNATDLLFGNININNPLWTLRWELLFSIALPIFFVIAVATRKLWWLVIIGSWVLVFVGILTANGSLIYLPVFLVGSVLAVKIDGLRQWVDAHAGRWWMVAGGAALLVVSLLLLDLRWSLWGALGGSLHLQVTATSLEFLGALGLVAVAAAWRPLEWLLSLGFFRWLGRLSFSLYLVHVPIIIGFDDLVPHWTPWLRIGLSLAVALVVAELFSRLVEMPAHRFSRWLGGRAASLTGR